MTNINEKNIMFYYDKHSLYIKIFVLFLICILCVVFYVVALFLLDNVPPKIFFASLYFIFCINISYIITITRYISDLKRFLEVSSRSITYYYYGILEPLISEIDFYWKDIISMEEISGIFSYKICITYKDNFNNKVKKKKIKIHDSEIPYQEIYNTLINMWNEYKINKS